MTSFSLFKVKWKETELFPNRKQLYANFADSYRRLDKSVLKLWGREKSVKMVELSDPKGPVQEGIDNSIFIVPGIIVAILICK